ncbi:MarR family transcriptional regulator [Streptomyces spectabilis]|uniref:MarR family transcriptional regulator n=1 Tax=Streptomyces spectabilis TaxID=68270 RepID=UPI001CEFAC35|nr:helix-turn-helix domain-containing protein [Streptomyces spectabilis]
MQAREGGRTAQPHNSLQLAPLGLPTGQPDPKEVHLSNPAFRSARYTAPILLALGAMNAWTSQRAEDYGAMSTALCLCVCAAGLYGEDLLQRGYHRDRAVLAHVAAHPGAATRHVARAVGASERVVSRNLDRLTDDGLLVLVTDGATPALRSYRLAS